MQNHSISVIGMRITHETTTWEFTLNGITLKVPSNSNCGTREISPTKRPNQCL